MLILRDPGGGFRIFCGFIIGKRKDAGAAVRRSSASKSGDGAASSVPDANPDPEPKEKIPLIAGLAAITGFQKTSRF
jgi:hypothetical protein